MMDAAVQEALFYITAGLCTLLAVVMSYRWLFRSPAERKDDGAKKEETKETPEEQDIQVPPGCPFGFGPLPTPDGQGASPDDADENISDLLINSSDIKPLNEEDKKRLEENGAGAGDPQKAEMLERRRVKELEEEVVKSMSEQQMEEEQRVRQSQLEAIFNLMQDNKDRFGMESVDDVQNQYKLYV